jgi:hypothetical protein
VVVAEALVEPVELEHLSPRPSKVVPVPNRIGCAGRIRVTGRGTGDRARISVPVSREGLRCGVIST